MNIVDKYRHDILSKLLALIGVSLDNLPAAVSSDKLEDPSVTAQFKEYIPVIRKFYSSDKLTALHSNAFDKQKNPGLNLIRQLLREHDYVIQSRNDRTNAAVKQFVVYKLPQMPLTPPESKPESLTEQPTESQIEPLVEKQRIKITLKKVPGSSTT